MKNKAKIRIIKDRTTNDSYTFLNESEAHSTLKFDADPEIKEINVIDVIPNENLSFINIQIIIWIKLNAISKSSLVANFGKPPAANFDKQSYEIIEGFSSFFIHNSINNFFDFRWNR